MMKRSVIRRGLVFLAAGVFAIVTAGALQAQPNDCWDSVVVKNVKSCYPLAYPEPPGIGKIKVEVWWHHPAPPASPGAAYLTSYLAWIGNAACDSIVGRLDAMLDSVFYEVSIDNNARSAGVGLFARPQYQFVFAPGHYHVADLFFTMSGTGQFSLNAPEPPLLGIPPVGISWYGIHVPAGVIIAKPGDADGNGTTDISDCVRLINYIFADPGGPIPCGDVDGNCLINVSDAVYLMLYIFAGGAPPSAGCCSWLP